MKALEVSRSLHDLEDGQCFKLNHQYQVACGSRTNGHTPGRFRSKCYVVYLASWLIRHYNPYITLNDLLLLVVQEACHNATSCNQGVYLYTETTVS